MRQDVDNAQSARNRSIINCSEAPKPLLFGTYSSLELLKYNSYRAKFLDTI